MKIEIESWEDYVRGQIVAGWLKSNLELWRTPDGLAESVGGLRSELVQAIDDYQQEHFPIGGEPKR